MRLFSQCDDCLQTQEGEDVETITDDRAVTWQRPSASWLISLCKLTFVSRFPFFSAPVDKCCAKLCLLWPNLQQNAKLPRMFSSVCKSVTFFSIFRVENGKPCKLYRIITLDVLNVSWLATNKSLCTLTIKRDFRSTSRTINLIQRSSKTWRKQRVSQIYPVTPVCCLSKPNSFWKWL